MDSAYLLEEEPYAALLLQFARASYGAFAPARVTLTPGTDATRLTFSVDARQYELELPPEPDEIPPAFYETVNRAMKEGGSPLRFIRIHQLDWGAVPGFALALPSAYRAAVKRKLLPVSDTDDIYSDDMERVTATIEMVFRGRETYVWSVDREPIGQITLRGGYDEETEDLRSKGLGVRTSFQYKGGILMLVCGGKSGEPIDLGPAFTPQRRAIAGIACRRQAGAKTARYGGPTRSRPRPFTLSTPCPDGWAAASTTCSIRSDCSTRRRPPTRSSRRASHSLPGSRAGQKRSTTTRRPGPP